MYGAVAKRFSALHSRLLHVVRFGQLLRASLLQTVHNKTLVKKAEHGRLTIAMQ